MKVPARKFPSLVVRGTLVQHLTDPLRDAAADLSLDHRGVDHPAAVFGDEVAEDLDPAGLEIDLDDARMSATRPAAAR